MKKSIVLLLLAAFALSGAEKVTPVWCGLFGKMKTIAVCAPGLPGSSAEVDAALKNLREAGYKVKVMPHARDNEDNRKLVDAKLRIADFQQAWLDPEVEAIWCVRGGFGSAAVAAGLDWEKLKTRNMPVIGFSNITELHSMMDKMQTGHIFTGPSLTQLTRCSPESVAWFGRAVAGLPQKPLKLKVLRGKACSGYASGGHLNMYHRMYRDGKAPSSEGRIIFLESPRKKDLVRYTVNALEALRKKGCFARCAAVVFGDIKGKTQEVDKLIRDFASKVSCPVFYGMPYGHCRDNFLIDFERKINISANGVLTVE